MKTPDAITPEQMIELESKCPDIARFLRGAASYGSKENAILIKTISEQSKIETSLAEAMSGYVPIGIFNMFLSELSDPLFKSGILERLAFPNRLYEIRAFVCKWFSSKGVIIELKEKVDEV